MQKFLFICASQMGKDAFLQREANMGSRKSDLNALSERSENWNCIGAGRGHCGSRIEVPCLGHGNETSNVSSSLEDLFKQPLAAGKHVAVRRFKVAGVPRIIDILRRIRKLEQLMHLVFRIA